MSSLPPVAFCCWRKSLLKRLPPPLGVVEDGPVAAARRGASGAPGRGRAAGGSPDKFSQFIRPLASQDVLLRGKTLYDAQLRQLPCGGYARRDGQGQQPVALGRRDGRPARRTHHRQPRQTQSAVTLVEADGVAASEYIHSVLATMGAQGSPPGRNPVGLQLNVLAGDRAGGQDLFRRALRELPFDHRRPEGYRLEVRRSPPALQNAWVAGSGGGGGRGGGGRGGGRRRKATVTLQNGQKLEGTLVREDDFLVVLTLPDGTRRYMPIENGWPKVDVADPQAAHKKMVLELDDPHNKNMHDVTAYLATLK